MPMTIHIGKNAKRGDGLNCREAKLNMKTVLLLLADGIAALPPGETRDHAAAALRKLNSEQPKGKRLAHEDLLVRGLDS